MPRCSRKGCNKDFVDGNEGPCVFHPGNPVFHEGLKSWSCCSDVHKPVLDFDEFMKFPGCTQTETHTTAAPQVEPSKPQPGPALNATETEDGKELYSTGPPKQTMPASSPSVPQPVVVEEEDDLSVPVPPGTTCRRKGCGVVFVSNEVNREGEGDGTVCRYHPLPPLFREGSKGYLCCKRKVLEFDEFLKIEGCKTGRHVFIAKSNDTNAEVMTTCRIDHYQTVDKVHVSVFAKQADKDRSAIRFEDDKIHLDIFLPSQRRFTRTLDLFGPINPDASSFKFYGTKVELALQKLDGRSWTLLEKTNADLGGIALTFGVGGRTGTTGAKDVTLDDTNKSKLNTQ